MLRRLYAHAQTVTAAVPARAPRLSEVVELSFDAALAHAGVLVVDCRWQPRPAPAVVVHHGVGGASTDAYVVRAARAVFDAGFHAVSVNHRGSGKGVGRSARLYHAGLSDDVELVVRFLERRADVTGIGLLGFSLGGHVALSWAAQHGDDAARRVRALATVSAPVELAGSLEAFAANRRTPARVYEQLMTKSLVDKARALKRTFPESATFSDDDLARVRTIVDFDALVTAPAHGFAGAHDYYQRVSVSRALGAIAVPTWMIHAKDDPIVPFAPLFDALDAGTRASGGAVVAVIEERGGHVGFVDNLAQLFGPTSAVARAIAHLQRHL